MNTKKLIMTALMASLIIVSTFIKFPIPGLSVQFTAQVLFILFAGMLLGAKHGALSVVIFILLGIVGVPVFSKGGGIGYFANYEMGYLLGFIPAAAICGLMTKQNKSFWNLLLAAVVAIVAMYAVALPYIYVLANTFLARNMEFGSLMTLFCLPFLPMDIAKAIIAAFVAWKVLPRISQH